MIKLKMDRTQGALLRQTSNGLEAQRTAYITGITQLRQALEHANLPRVGQAHPDIEDLVARSITAKPDGPNAAIITIDYHNPAGSNNDIPQVKVGSALRQQSTETDLSGNRITVAYSASGEDTDLSIQGARVAVLRPQTELTFSRLETTHPASTAKTYAGTVNRSNIFDGGPGTWLCTAISGNSDDGGQTFLVTYLFQYNAEGWQPIVSYTDPKTNRPPADLVGGVGIKRVTLYRDEEFKNMGLGS
jgi:hypothetical protein